MPWALMKEEEEEGETYLLSILKGSDNITLRILSFWICASKQHQILES
jgi:hypothetical protein